MDHSRALTAKIAALGGHYVLTVEGNAHHPGQGPRRQEIRTIRPVTLPASCDSTLTGVAQAARVRRSKKRKKIITTPAAWTHENVYTSPA